MKKILATVAAALFAFPALAQVYPSPTYQDLLVLGTTNLVGNLSVGTLPIYPVTPPGSGYNHFDTSSLIMANTLASKNLFVGAAALNGNQWLNSGTIFPGVDGVIGGTTGLSIVANYTMGFPGIQLATVDAIRTSDVSATSVNVIAGSDIAVGDNTTNPLSIWGRYIETVIPATSDFVEGIGLEDSFWNQGSDLPGYDPFGVNPSHLGTNLRLDCGVGTGTDNRCSSPMDIVNNGAEYKTGIVFGADSLQLTDGFAPMISAPSGYGFSWYTGLGDVAWNFLSNASETTYTNSIIMGDGTFDIFLVNGATDFNISQAGLKAPSFIANGTKPTATGTCAINSQQGGMGAGDFAYNGACASGTVIFTFAKASTTGWACSASSVDGPTHVIYESTTTTTTVTFTVSGATNGEFVTFHCQGY